MPTKLPRVLPGDKVCVDDINALFEAAEASELSVGPGLLLTDNPQGGKTLSVSEERTFDAKITGPLSSGTYPWLEVFPASGGTWANGSRTGVAYEENSFTGVATGTVVKMWRTVVNDYRFRASAC